MLQRQPQPCRPSRRVRRHPVRKGFCTSHMINSCSSGTRSPSSPVTSRWDSRSIRRFRIVCSLFLLWISTIAKKKGQQDMLTSASLYTPTGCNKPRFQVRAARPSSYERLESHRLNAHTMQWLYICKCPPGAPKLLPDSPDSKGPANGMYTTWHPSNTQKRGKGDELTTKDNLLRRQ